MMDEPVDITSEPNPKSSPEPDSEPDSGPDSEPGEAPAPDNKDPASVQFEDWIWTRRFSRIFLLAFVLGSFSACDFFGVASKLERHSEQVFSNVLSPFYGYSLTDRRIPNAPKPTVVLLHKRDFENQSFRKLPLRYCDYLAILQSIADHQPAAIFIDSQFDFRSTAWRDEINHHDPFTPSKPIEGARCAQPDDIPDSGDGLLFFLSRIANLRPQYVDDLQARDPIPVYFGASEDLQGEINGGSVEGYDRLLKQIVDLDITYDGTLHDSGQSRRHPGETKVKRTPAQVMLSHWCQRDRDNCPDGKKKNVEPFAADADYFVRWARYRPFDQQATFDHYLYDGRCSGSSAVQAGFFKRLLLSVKLVMLEFWQHNNTARGSEWDRLWRCPAIPYLYLTTVIQANLDEAWQPSHEDYTNSHTKGGSKVQVVNPIKDHIIILGRAENAHADIVHSPVNGPLPGAFIHAMALDNFLHGQGNVQIQPPNWFGAFDISDFIELLVFCVASLLAYWLYDRLHKKHLDVKSKKDPGYTSWPKFILLLVSILATFLVALVFLIAVSLFLLLLFTHKYSPAGWLGTIGAISVLFTVLQSTDIFNIFCTNAPNEFVRRLSKLIITVSSDEVLKKD